MMSAHELAVAALGEAAAVDSRPRDDAPSPAAHDIAGGATHATAIIPNSTNSALASSQMSNTAIESVSSYNSQSTVPDADTPPSSGFSSQSHDQAHGVTRVNDIPPLAVATNAGQKRTIDGYVRRSSGSSSSDSPVFNRKGRHTRNASAVSAVSSAMSPRELTSELRTRLSYAMVKVNKGWESLPIYEVESLASQSGSPTPSNSTINGRRNTIASPRATIASLQGLSGASPKPHPTAAAPTDSQESASDGQPSSRTYESFWREQSQRQIGLSASLSSPSSSQLSLQPSAELSSASRTQPNYRRSPVKSSKPHMLSAASSSDLSQSSLSSGGVGPNTPAHDAKPPNRGDTVLQTPTQKSLQEQDAIETLLFMSSPGNPMLNNFPGAQSQGSRMQSPLKTEFGAQGTSDGKSDDSSVTPRAYETGTARYRGRRRIGVVGKGRLGEDELDRILDTMENADSSDDEIELPTTPMRSTIGRV
ncbi:hypothetical protein V502_01332 [Pseudogymnoascus sp. VKM F-4520 (FW-2644)]|nr:hypothetical protein V502_01332 [Pseudogymnoascus sp. VKM F-4520 (FW-2644)]